MGNFLGGMFDPTREGPGVSKDGPQKKRFFLFFEIYFRKFTKIVLLNLIYVLVCLPIVTIGPATAAMAYCMRNFTREEHADISDFFDQFKKNFWQSLLVSVIQLVCFGVITFGLFFYYSLMSQGNVLGFFGFCVALMAAVLFVFMSYYIYMLIVTFKQTLRQLIKNSFLFAFLGLGRNIITTIILVLIYGWFAIYGVLPTVMPLFDPNFPASLDAASLALAMYLVFLPSLTSFIVNFNIYPCVKRFMLDPAMAELEKQRQEEETIFED